jgi:hypothetical protein
MPLSEKTKNILFAPFAISLIMERCWLPGLLGMVLFAVGLWQHVGWLRVTGIILAAPILWVYAVVIFAFLPFALFDHVRRKMRGH